MNKCLENKSSKHIIAFSITISTVRHTIFITITITVIGLLVPYYYTYILPMNHVIDRYIYAETMYVYSLQAPEPFIRTYCAYNSHPVDFHGFIVS